MHYYVKTGIPQLDVILSGDGLLLGKLYEIYGEESTSKSTLAQFFAKKFQEQYLGNVYYIDTEQSFDLARYSYMGGNAEKIQIYQEIELEKILKYIIDVLDKSVASKLPAFIIVDTIASTMTKSEIEKGGFAGGISEKARVISQVMPKIVKLLEDSNSVLLIVNQVYDIIGGVGGKKSKGGRSIKYYASVRIDVQRIKDKLRKVNDLELVEGIGVKLTTQKNKLFYPRLSTYIYVHNELGVQELESIVEYLKENKLVSTSGAWSRFQYDDIDIKFNNADTLQINIDKNPKIYDAIKYLIIEKYVNISPLTKVKLIKELNKLEEILGKPLTKLTDRELYLASLEEKKINLEEDKDE